MTTFGAAYMLVLLVEPVADIAALAKAQALRDTGIARVVSAQLHTTA